MGKGGLTTSRRRSSGQAANGRGAASRACRRTCRRRCRTKSPMRGRGGAVQAAGWTQIAAAAQTLSTLSTLVHNCFPPPNTIVPPFVDKHCPHLPTVLHCMLPSITARRRAAGGRRSPSGGVGRRGGGAGRLGRS